MKKDGKKNIAVIISIFLLIVISVGIFAIITSYRVSLIPSMTFEEMLSYTTKDNEDAVITVGIIKDENLSFTVYGENTTVLPNKEFEYEIGSVTKTFTASLLCKAIDEGKVRLSDPIDQYIKISKKDYYPNFKRLVTHTSGYKNYYFDRQMISNFFNGEKNDFYGINTEILNHKIGEVSIEDKDYAFNYSNFGISVVGSALAEIYGSDFTTVMNNFITSELKLKNTKISNGLGDLDGYWNWKPNDGYIPAGAVISTISDMMKYVKLHISEELSYLSLGHEKLAQVNGTTKELQKMGIRLDATGIGWMIDTDNNIIWHNGGTSNFNSYIAFDKEKHLGVVILSNLSPNYRIPATVMGAKLIMTLQNE